MNAATLLIILLSHHGYWFGGQGQSISVAWPVDQKTPAAHLHWELMLGGLQLTAGEANMPRDDVALRINLKLPEVRTKVKLHWDYQITDAKTGHAIGQGKRDIIAFPQPKFTALAAEYSHSRLIVVDRDERLTAYLSAEKIPFDRMEDVAGLQTASADVVIVASNQLGDSALAQQPLLSLARSGTQVLILPQKAPAKLLGYPLSHRDVSRLFQWRIDHPLFDGFDENELNDWVSDLPQLRNSIQLPLDEPALEIAYWRREVPGKQAAPIDALAVVKSIGAGRLVLWQIPMDDPAVDPRSSQFIYNALSYLLLRPEPTPRPSDRPTTQPQQPAAAISTIPIPSGEKP